MMMPDAIDNDGYELIDTEVYETCGLFSTPREAADYAATYHIKSFHVYDDAGVLVMER